jgi:hypothetical protein
VARRIAGDWALVRELGTQARATALRLDWGRIVDAVEAQYASAIELAAPATPASPPRLQPAAPAQP